MAGLRWTLTQLAELFGRDRSVISRHITRALLEGELDEDVAYGRAVKDRLEGERTVAREVQYFDLATLLAVGYRITSPRGTALRIWATERVRRHAREPLGPNRHAGAPQVALEFEERLLRSATRGSGLGLY